MTAYRKFSEARWPTPKSGSGGPHLKHLNHLKLATEMEPTLGALGGLVGYPPVFENQRSGRVGHFRYFRWGARRFPKIGGGRGRPERLG